MNATGESIERESVLGGLARKWRVWQHGRAALAELEHCGTAERRRIASDVGMNEGELCVLAGRWPDTLDLLRQRMEQLKLNAADGVQIEPEVVRDLQRTCALCMSKRQCAHDFAKRAAGPVWQEYCPNAMTFSALLAEAGKHLRPDTPEGKYAPHPLVPTKAGTEI
jgi:hypothetical protein